MNPARELAEGMRWLERHGLTQGTSGNLSVRTAAGFMVTPSGIPAAFLKAEDMVVMDMEGRVHGAGRPSSEWRMHRDIYRAFPAAGAVVHAHPPHATALSCLRRAIPPFHYMVAVAGGHDIPCARYATFGTPELSDHAVEALQGRSACLLANHGVLCHAADLERGLALTLEVETLARQYLLACQHGEPVLLDAREMDEILERFKHYGAHGGQRAEPRENSRQETGG